ncbi:hypothetical protein MNBD_ACTINO01-206 [hydrothermal vent metagenome]|uniref:Uncharacterized protein n=1 Tax=hydrothermal vent metagenome TaxID=652676 RepID=A0A3B0SVP5_9ZZZZ
MDGRKQFIAGIALILLGLVVTIVASIVAHMAGSAQVDEFGRQIFPGVPRGWQMVTLAQLVAVGGVLLSMAGATYGFIWQRPLTWSRAMLGALLFAGLMFILFAIIPNEFLTLTQATLEWTPQKTFLVIPSFLVLNNEVSISLAVVKDMISAGYATTLLILIPVLMYKWQEREKKPDVVKPEPVSLYGRPLRAGN